MKKTICVIAAIAAALAAVSGISRLSGLKKDSEGTENVKADKRFSLEAAVEDGLEHMDENGSAVYFTKDISPDGMLKIYEALGWKPAGKVAVKISTGEPPASNYLRPELIKDLVQSVSGTIVECNTAYGGSRSETAMHMQVAKDHGFTEIADVDIQDAEGSMQLPVTGGRHLEADYVGTHFKDYDSYLVLSHFKGHSMAGFGGAVKNISIGLGSVEGKSLIHSGGTSHTNPWGGEQTAFTESMAEAGKAVSDYLGNGERIAYINVLNNISIDCDCDGNPAKPDIHDIGILASKDPVAIDQASLDLCFAAEGSESLRQRVEQLDGVHTLEYGEEIGLGSRTYKLEDISEAVPEDSETQPPATQSPASAAETPSPCETRDPGSVEGNSRNEGTTLLQGSEAKHVKKPEAPRKITKLKIKYAKKNIIISWKKTAGADGYQVQASLSKKFKKKDVIFEKYVKKAKVKIPEKKAGKKVRHVRVRPYAAYKNEKGEKSKAYGGWSRK